MAEASDPLLLSKSAQKLIAKSDGIPGTVQITNSKVRWKANDASAAKSVAIDISSITSEFGASRGIGGISPSSSVEFSI